MPLTEKGFERPSYNEILENQINRAKMLFGETIDTSEISALGKYIRINVADLDALYQTLEGVYYARFPNTATGLSLDRLCPFAGIKRNPATYAKHRILITGTVGAVIGADFEVSVENQSVTFHLTDTYKIGDNGTVEAIVECNVSGEVGNIISNDINTIVNPSADVENIVGIEIVKLGTNRESDAALRSRFALAIAGTGSGTAEAIKGAIMRVSGVDDCTIIENATPGTVNGIHPYSFVCYVLSDETPATDQLIGQAIFSKKPLGISASGSVRVSIKDNSGNEHGIAFERAVKKNVYMHIDIKTDSNFSETGIAQIKNNIVSYLAGFSNGSNLYLSSLYSYINIDGVVCVTTLELSTDDTNFSATNIYCNNNEAIRTTADLITITVNEV